MKSFTASDARSRFGRLLETVQREPAVITKNGRFAAVLISASDKSLTAAIEEFLEERCWGKRIARAERSGYLGVEESPSILNDALNARG